MDLEKKKRSFPYLVIVTKDKEAKTVYECRNRALAIQKANKLLEVKLTELGCVDIETTNHSDGYKWRFADIHNTSSAWCEIGNTRWIAYIYKFKE